MSKICIAKILNGVNNKVEDEVVRKNDFVFCVRSTRKTNCDCTNVFTAKQSMIRKAYHVSAGLLSRKMLECNNYFVYNKVICCVSRYGLFRK